MTKPSNRRLAIAFAVLTLVFVLATLPMAAAIRWSGLVERGFSARSVKGSIWSAEAEDTALGALRLGDLKLRTALLPMLLGKLELRFAPAVEGTAGPSGSARISSGGVALNDVDINLPAAAFMPTLGQTAVLMMQGFDVVFDGGKCTSANGEISTELSIPDAPPGMGRVALSGTAACENDKLLLPLSGATGAGDARLFIHVDGSGNYAYDLSLAAGDPAFAAKLSALGLSADGGNYRLGGTGSL